MKHHLYIAQLLWTHFQHLVHSAYLLFMVDNLTCQLNNWLSCWQGSQLAKWATQQNNLLRLLHSGLFTGQMSFPILNPLCQSTVWWVPLDISNMPAFATYHLVTSKRDAESNVTKNVRCLAHILSTTSQHHFTVAQHYLLQNITSTTLHDNFITGKYC